MRLIPLVTFGAVVAWAAPSTADACSPPLANPWKETFEGEVTISVSPDCPDTRPVGSHCGAWRMSVEGATSWSAALPDHADRGSLMPIRGGAAVLYVVFTGELQVFHRGRPAPLNVRARKHLTNDEWALIPFSTCGPDVFSSRPELHADPLARIHVSQSGQRSPTRAAPPGIELRFNVDTGEVQRDPPVEPKSVEKIRAAFAAGGAAQRTSALADAAARGGVPSRASEPALWSFLVEVARTGTEADSKQALRILGELRNPFFNATADRAEPPLHLLAPLSDLRGRSPEYDDLLKRLGLDELPPAPEPVQLRKYSGATDSCSNAGGAPPAAAALLAWVAWGLRGNRRLGPGL